MVRQGLVNLQRPGNQSAAVLTALGLGVMLMMTIYFVQHAIVQDLQMNSGSPSVPNVFLVDVGADELAGVEKLVAAQPAVKGGVETIPIVSARITSLNGVPTDQLRIQHYPKRMLRSTSLTWADKLPAGEKVVNGKWWNSGQRQAAGSRQRFNRKSVAPEGRFCNRVCDGREDICRGGSRNCSRGRGSHLLAQPIHLAEPCADWTIGGLVRRVPR